VVRAFGGSRRVTPFQPAPPAAEGRKGHAGAQTDFREGSRGTPGGGLSPRGAIALGAVYVVAVALLFASRVREFADETDNLLGGLLLTRGERLYVDYFSSHMPLAYYVSAIPALFGASTLEHFRVFSNALLVAATVATVWTLRNSLPLVTLGTWATLTVFAHTLQWGEMLTAGTIAAFGVAAAGLIFFTTPGLHFGPSRLLGVSIAVFVAIQSELLAFFPLLLLAVCFVAVRVADVIRGQSSRTQAFRETGILLVAVAAPHAAVLLGFWLTGALPDFVFDAYQFNEVAYSHFVMNPSVAGMLHDWEAQYRTYLRLSLQEPLQLEASLIVANVLAAWVVFRARGLLVAVLYYLFIALTRVRNADAYYVCSYFSLALLLTYAIDLVRRRQWRAEALVAAAGVVVGLNFAVQVAGTYDFTRRPTTSPMVPIVQALTLPGEEIFVAPYDPYIYLASERMPASRYPFFFPWQAIDPRSEGTLISDLRTERPPLVVFRRNEKVNGQWLTGEYGARVYDALISEGYAPLDQSSPLLDDVLVRPDRLSGARAQLSACFADPTASPDQPRP
jgi:hypothetical protein